MLHRPSIAVSVAELTGLVYGGKVEGWGLEMGMGQLRKRLWWR
jgi:hypothetical protein